MQITPDKFWINYFCFPTAKQCDTVPVISLYILYDYCPTDTFSRGFADIPHDQNVTDLPLYFLSMICCRNPVFELRRPSGLSFDRDLPKDVHVSVLIWVLPSAPELENYSPLPLLLSPS